MDRYAVILNGIVVNIIISDCGKDETYILITGMDPMPGTGWTYDGNTFTPPQVIPGTFYSLTLKAFWKRFTVAERETLQNILATGTQNQKNKLNAFRDYLLTGGKVELIDDYIINSVNLMETANVIAAGRANTILNTPITASEQ